MDLLDQTPIIATQILPESPEVPTLPPPPPKSRLFPIIAAILIALLLGATALFSYKYFTLKSQLITTPTPFPTTVATNPMGDWKMFSNEIYSLKYPNNWDTYFINGNTDGTLMVAPKEKVDKVRGMSGGFGGGIFLTMSISINAAPPSWKTDENWIVSQENITINGVSGTKYTVNVIQDLPGLTKGDQMVSVVIKHNDSYVQIDLLDKDQITTLDQILSTFKFSDTTNPEITFSAPKSGAVITSPVTIKGTAPKGWTFESILNVSIEDDKHQLLSGGPVSTKEIAGTDTRVSFETSVNFASTTETGYITVKNDNPSGLPENDKSFSLPIKFTTSSTGDTTYTCPTSEWVDCMPGPGPAKPQCTSEYLRWAKQNCPGFQGAAL